MLIRMSELEEKMWLPECIRNSERDRHTSRIDSATDKKLELHLIRSVISERVK